MRRSKVYPRVGGGTRAYHPISRYPMRSIPAWAGEPARPRPRGARNRVYPRVGGGTVDSESESVSVSGLSPRGRGNRDDPTGRRDRIGSIPAWAGEPGWQ